MSDLLIVNTYVEQLVLSVLIGLISSFVLEFLLLVPRKASSLNRGMSCYLVHSGSWLSLFLLCLILFQRPWFAVLLTMSFQLLVLAVNFMKYRSLREPFILQDFEYFYDVIRHPRLYLPFFGIGNAIMGASLFIALVYTALLLEDSALKIVDAFSFFLTNIIFLILCLAVTRITAAVLPLPTLTPEADLRLVGMYASFWSYFMAFRRSPELVAHPIYNGNLKAPDMDLLPDLVVVQSESFFDPRLSYPVVRKDVLKHFDRIANQSLLHGQVVVPAWGANTVRTESSFLTGLTAGQMGIHQFNPYWYLSHTYLPNLVSKLKSLGYKTICIHPYPVGFYRRDLVFPKLGFDRFIDITDFSAELKDGQYISDIAVTDKLKAVLEQESGPCFIFTITMENHGPLHLESPEGLDVESLYQEPVPEKADDLSVYLRHLQNADQMIDTLTQNLMTRSRKAYLCWYGDHVPVMANVYKTMGDPVAETPFFIWCNQPDPVISARQRFGVEQLSVELFKRAVDAASL